MSEDETSKNPPWVFISYAQYEPVHSERVLALAHALEDDGLDVELDQFHAQELINWPRWCEERLRPEESDFVLMVCSAEYRRRIEGRVERAQGRGVFWEGNLIYGYLYRAKANERFVPLLLGDESETALPPIVANWNWFRLRGFGLKNGDAGYENLYRLLTSQPAMRRPERGTVVQLPPPAPPLALEEHAVKPINLPYPSLGSLFKGREDMLAGIRGGFEGEPKRTQAIVARHTIHGLGGIGKTRAAVEYAWRHAEDYTTLLFVTAQSPADLRTKLAALCDLLGLSQGVTEEDERVRAVLDWLVDPAHAGWLLIVDNVDTADAAQAVEQTLAPLSGGHVLITGRLSEWPADMRARRVDVLDPDAARDFLLERTADKRQVTDDDPQQAQILAAELGYLALALEQAAAFIRRHAQSFADYRRRWQSAEQKVLQWHDPRTMQYERPLATTWQATVEGLPPAARAMLNLLAWLAPEPLPRFLFDHSAAPQALGHLFEDQEDPRAILRGLSGDPQADPEEALAALRDSSLLQPSEESKLASEGQVHRVLALITRERQHSEDRSAALEAALSLVDAAAVGESPDVRTWPVWEPMAPHVHVLVAHAEAVGIAAPTARLLNDLGLLLNAKARHAESEPLYRRALAIEEASLGPEHPNIAIRLNNLALLLQETNRLAEAEALHHQALAIDEASLGPEHPKVAVDLNNLALLLKATNRLAEAEILYRRALAIDEASLGPEHPTVAIRLSNLATLYSTQGRYGEAEPLYRRAIAIGEASLGPEHPAVAIRLSNLALLLEHINQLAEAETLMRLALAIHEASLGPEHPSVATDLNNLAALLKATNRLAEAEPLMRRALAINEASLGPEHPSVATDLNNLAALFQDTNRLAEAEPLMRRAVEILQCFQTETGHPHPNLEAATANYENLLAQMHRPLKGLRAWLGTLVRGLGIPLGR